MFDRVRARQVIRIYECIRANILGLLIFNIPSNWGYKIR